MTIAKRTLTIALSAMLALGTLALAGCNSDKNDQGSADQQSQSAADEQDNCYGDDLPVINNQ